MSSKTITRGLIGIVIVIFTIYFSLFHVLFDSGSTVINLLNRISEAAKQERWEVARTSNQELKRIWGKYEYFFLFNYAETEYALFMQSASRLENAIEQKEKYETIKEASDVLTLWQDFGKVVPKP